MISFSDSLVPYFNLASLIKVIELLARNRLKW